jgi:hypothetical protein
MSSDNYQRDAVSSSRAISKKTRTFHVYGNSRVFNRKVWESEEELSFRSIERTLAVVESIVVNHTRKLVIGYQAKVSMMTDQAFVDTDTIDEFLVMLGMIEDSGLEYKLVIIGVVDLSQDKPTGLAFRKNNISRSLREWQQLMVAHCNTASLNYGHDEQLASSETWENAPSIQV